MRLTNKKKVFIYFATEGYLVDTRPPVLQPVLDPLAAYTSRTVYILFLNQINSLRQSSVKSYEAGTLDQNRMTE